MKINALITGVTGMVGEGVLQECLKHPDVEAILVLNRRPCGVVHPKLKEIIHENFTDMSPIEKQLKGYNACFFCLGVTSIGKKEPEYYALTYTLTMNIAKTLAALNPSMTFCYISGAGTDSSEKGRIMWARVKGKTENDLMKLPFKNVFAFRPGFIIPTEEGKNVHKYYKWFGFMNPLLRTLMPKFVSTLQELGIAMINAALKGYDKKILEVKDIISLSKLE